jgi:hypothetical protein
MTTPSQPTPAPTPEDTPHGRSRSERTTPRRRRWLWVVAVLLIVVPIIFWVVLARSFITRRTILAVASDKIGADITAASVVVGLDGTVVLRDAVARARNIQGDGGVLFSVHHMEITVEWSSIFDAVPRFTSVVLDAPLLRVSQNTADGSLNIDALTLASPTTPPTLSTPPTVTITRGVLELGEHSGETFTSLRRLEVEGSIKRSPDIADRWLISLGEIASAVQGTPLSVVGHIDSAGLSLSMEGMTLGEWTDANVPTLLRQTFRELALQGRVGRTTFAVGSSGEVSATMELAGMSLNLPVDTQPEEDRDGNKIPLPPEQVGRQLRMEDVRGTLTYADGFMSGDFTGNLEELPYHVRLVYGGTSAIAPFTLELNCTGFELRKNPQIMRFAPGVAQRRFAQFSQPTGIVDATVTVRRPAPIDGKEADLSVTGDIVLRDGSASFERFPYLFEKMRGHWRFSEDELEIVQIQGEASSGAKCFGYGRISPLTDEAGADIQVEITDLPIDDRLIEALGPKRKIVDALFNAEQYRRLVDEGLVISPQRQAEAKARLDALASGASPSSDDEKARLEAELRRPVFALGGKARVYVDVQRAVGMEGVWLDTITITLPSAGLVPENFPFPLIAQNFTIVKLNDAATVTDGVLVGLSGGRAVANANADLLKLEEPGLPFVPEITLKGSNIPVDALLIAAVPESLSGSTTSPRNILKALGVGGVIANADVSIGMTPENDVGYTVSLDLTNAQARPASIRPGAPLPRIGAQSLAGLVVLTQDRLTLDMKGDVFRLDSPEQARPVAFEAEINFEEGTDSNYNADIRAQRFDLSIAVEDVVATISKESAAKIEELRVKYFPTGVVDADVHIESVAQAADQAAAQAPEPKVRLVVTNPSVDFDFESSRVGLHDAKGAVTIDVGSPGRATFELLEGDLVFDAALGGRVSIDGVSTLELGPAGEGESLSIALDGAVFEAPLTRHVIEKVMSRGVLEWYDRLKPRGSLRTSMVLTPDPATQSPSPETRSWLVEGSVVPRSLTISTGAGDVPFTSIEGSVAFRTGGGSLKSLKLTSPVWAVQADGSWTAMSDGATSLHMDLSGSCVSLPPTLLDLLPPEVGELVADLKINTPLPVTLRDSSIAMILPPDQGPDQPAATPAETRFTGTFETNGVWADLGVEVADLIGAASVSYSSAEGRGTYDVRLLASRAYVEGVKITQARARVTGETDGDTIVPMFAADCHGGRVAGKAIISSTPDGRKNFEVDARISDARFAPILADVEARRESAPSAVVEETSAAPGIVSGPQAPATSAALDESRGRLDAEFSLTGIVNDVSSRRGRGTIIVGGERVINVPLLVPLMRISNLQLPTSERLDFASARFFLSGELVNLEEMIVSSRSVVIEGVGTATLPNYDLDLRFKARNKTGIPLVSKIVQGIRNELVSMEVRGTLANPDIRLRPFAGARRVIGSAVGADRSAPQHWLDELETQPRVPIAKPGGHGEVVIPRP